MHARNGATLIFHVVDWCQCGEQAQQADKARTAAEARVTPATEAPPREISHGEKNNGGPWAISVSRVYARGVEGHYDATFSDVATTFSFTDRGGGVHQKQHPEQS